MTVSGVGSNWQIFNFGANSTQNLLTCEEQVFLKQLIDLPLHLILDRDETENRCWVIGQQIYDKFKNENVSNPYAGKEAVEKIFNAISFYCTDGNIRKEYIGKAWDEVGDDVWSWKARGNF